MAHSTHKLTTLLLISLTALWAGCGDDSSPPPSGQVATNNTNNTNNANNPPDNNTVDPDPIPDNTVLSYASGPTVDVLFGESQEIAVKYSSAAGAPIAGATVSFAPEEGADLQLEARSAVTDGGGIASVRVFAGTTVGSHVVMANALNAESLPISVRTYPQGSAAYIVSSSYAGVARLETLEVQLLDSTNRCDALTPSSLPSPLATEAVEVRRTHIPEAWFSDLSNNTGYTVVALGTMAPGVIAAYGCNDVATPIMEGNNVEVSLMVDEILPEISGSFDIETRLNLINALPEPWQSNLEFIGTLFTNPALIAVDILFGDPDDQYDGLVGDLLGDGPGLRAVAEGIINDLLNQAFGSTLNTYFAPGGSVYYTMTQLTLTGTLDIAGEPPLGGGDIQSGVTGHSYDGLVVFWTVGCEPNDLECGRVEIPLSTIADMGVISSDFTGEVIAGKSGHFLALDPHTFDFNYGAVALALFEQIVLPQVFGVQTFADAISQIVDCGAIADAYFPNLDQITENGLAIIACEEAIDIAVDMVLARLTGAQAGIPGLTLATSSATAPPHCPLFEANYGPEDTIRRFVSLGKRDARCEWDAQLGGSSTLPADFIGER